MKQTLYMIRFQDNRVIEGLTMSDLARFESNSLYTVHRANGSDLSIEELEEWERESERYWSGLDALPVGIGQRGKV